MGLKDQLLAKIDKRTACVGVVGLGYVGLPLALEFARAGLGYLSISKGGKFEDAKIVEHLPDKKDIFAARQRPQNGRCADIHIAVGIRRATRFIGPAATGVPVWCVKSFEHRQTNGTLGKHVNAAAPGEIYPARWCEGACSR